MVVNLQWLKSDHYGIEMDHTLRVLYIYPLLKSDHYGIEISSQVTVQVATPNVKIRPLWD